jgi:protoporphyrinogen oxidase
MYAARRSGLKNEMFGYVEGGYEKVLKKFYDKLTEQQVNFRFNVIVNKIEKNKKKVEVQSDKGETLCFDKVICALPSSIAANIVMGLNEEEQKAHKSIEYMGVICPSFLLKKPLTPYYITNITDSTIPFTGIIEMTALVDKDTFDGNNLIYLPKYLKSSDNLFNINESEIIDYFFSNLQKMYPQLNKEDIIASNLAKSRNVFALNTLNYSEKLPAVTTSVEGVFILNSAQIVNGTLNINESIQLSEKFLPQIIDA